MAPRLTPSAKGTRSSRKANAIGFAARLSRKADAADQTERDVYEYSSDRNKRASITLSLDKDESLGLSTDETKNGDFDWDALRARIMSTDEGDGAILAKDDEEIESDDAFEESDEERFAGISFSKKFRPKRPKRNARAVTAVRFADVDLDEGDTRTPVRETDQDEDDEEVDGNSDEFLDVLDVLDGRGEPDLGTDEEQKSSEEDPGVEQEEEYDEEEESDDEDMADAFAPSDTELQPDGEALDNLDAFVSQLETGKKRKAEDLESSHERTQASARKRRLLKERTEAGEEGEFGVHAASGSKLQLDDLLMPLASKSPSLQALRKSIKPLTKNGALSAPLPQRTQDRLDREAAYEQTKEEVDKWKPTMRRIKEAEHLSFPLQVPQKVNPSNSGLAAKFTPSNTLENAVDKLLKAAQLREESDIAKTEELKMNHLSVEEVAERRAELRKMRELIFRADAKAKRIAKIKSKTYRKIQRKHRDRIKGLVKEAEGGDDEGDAEEEQLKREIERARERATLRHKNTGKWARAMKERGELEVDQRRDLEEMLEKGERLRARIQGLEGSENDQSGSDEEDEVDGDIDRIKATAFEELRKVEEDDEALSRQGVKGVFAMKFMQEAAAREAHKADATVDDFRDEMERMEHENVETDDENHESTPSGVQVQRMGGRVVYRPSHSQATVPLFPVARSESSTTLKSSEPALQSPVVASQVTIRSSPPIPPTDRASEPSPPAPPAADASNPWLVPRSSSVTQPRRKNNVLVGKDSTAAVKSSHLLKKRLSKGVEERQKARDDAVVEISPDALLTLPERSKAQEDLSRTAETSESNGKGKTRQNHNLHDDVVSKDSDEENSEVEAQERRIELKGKSKGVTAFEQRDLVALAFAGDNVVQDFEKLKQREVAADAPREEDHTLPGWGSWGGAGTKRNPHAKKFIKRIAGVDPKSRADYGKPHLIISEKKDKRAAKYLTKDLPYPYTSKAQFERGLEVPVGTEWNTRVGFQRQTLPQVVKKMGTVIDPLEKIF